MDKPALIIVKTGQAVPQARALGGDFEDWFAAGLGPAAFDYQTVRVDRDQPLPPPDALRGSGAVLVTGSPAMVSHREAWSERTARWLADCHALGLPMLGVCYGHQLIAHALGGRVGPNPNGRRMGRARLDDVAADDALLGPLAGIHAPAAFHVSHLEAVLEPPSGARVIATSPHDAFHALHFGNRTWGVQFHPEFDRAVMRAYIEARRDLLTGEGQDPDALLAGLADEPPGQRFLGHFAALARASLRHSGRAEPA